MQESDDSVKFTKSEAQDYWKSPNDGANNPLEYIVDSERLRERNALLLSVFEKHVDREDAILEIGCNAGRNLHNLWAAGYRNLSAVELSEPAIEVMKQHLPSVYRDSKITIGAIEDVIKTISSKRYDVIFSMAVMIHLPPESEWIFKEIARRAKKKIIVFEGEGGEDISVRHFPRNYKRIFTRLKRPQIEQIWPAPGLPRSYVCRVFGPRPE
ncbi:class I SAM-dependent methyltransferase [Ensifer adhaerens]|uniref:class I SAM-dependent methyltransferase n=1 Tax=Ensifer adhaerens TaxID=106592 RepID=UPI00132EAD71|nr:class I SAM-dependent methyltransferase [Ensifer adhaerens]QHG73098.1 methyltransferase domain-containing protein [Ensifer adhaerens]